MALGTVWESGSWVVGAWADGTWAEAALLPDDFLLKGVNLEAGEFSLLFDKLSDSSASKGSILIAVNANGDISQLNVGSNGKVLSANSAVSAGLEWVSNGFNEPTELTLSGGAVTLTGTSKFRFHTIDTEDDAATDDLTAISGGNPGDILILYPEHTDRTVVVKNNSVFVMGIDFSMNKTGDIICLVNISANVWYQLSRWNTGT